MLPNEIGVSFDIPMMRFLEATQSESYLGAAENLLLGAAVLDAAHAACPPHALAMLCAQSLECILKAYLTQFAVSVAWLKEKAGHDITQLWERAFDEGFAIESPTPDWVQRLAELHGRPYILRYARVANQKENGIWRSDKGFDGFHCTSFPVLRGLPERLSVLAGKVRIELEKVPR